MKLRMIRNTIVQGEPHVAGDVVDVADADATLLLRLKKAIAYDDAERAVVEPQERAVAKPQRKTRRSKRP